MKYFFPCLENNRNDFFQYITEARLWTCFQYVVLNLKCCSDSCQCLVKLFNSFGVSVRCKIVLTAFRNDGWNKCDAAVKPLGGSQDPPVPVFHQTGNSRRHVIYWFYMELQHVCRHFLEFLWNSLNTEVWEENRSWKRHVGTSLSVCWKGEVWEFLGILCLSKASQSFGRRGTSRIRNAKEAVEWQQLRTVGRLDSSTVHEGMEGTAWWNRAVSTID